VNYKFLKKTLLTALLMPVLFLAAGGRADAENRTALLIANGDYRHFGSLSNPIPEARALVDTLRKLGFDVTVATNANRENMLDAVEDFENKLRTRKGLAFFHYGGHAVQVAGRNYLIPADAQIPDERRVATRALDVEEVMAGLSASGSDTNIVVLDACRTNPLPASSGRTSTRGLSVIGVKPRNSVIVYAAEAGTEARDGVFTPLLVKHIATSGISLSEVLQNVRREVYEKTGGAQTPGEYNQLFSSIYLAGSLSARQAPSAVTPAPQPAARPVPEGMVRVEGGTFMMGDTFGDGDSDEKTTRSVTVSGFYMGKHEVTAGEFKRFVQETGYRTQAESSGGGSVWTGSNWEQKADANWKNPYFPQDDRHPVVLVSWNDATEYCNWLSRKEGLRPAYSGSGSTISCDFSANGYRLPTEAEWEYAAKGGNRSGGYKYSGGNDPGSVGWYNANSGYKTQPVGGKQANELGLYDLTGNVWEWCWDWYGSYDIASQNDPRGPSSGGIRVRRGGGWGDDARNLRTAFRSRNSPESRNYILGFRVARS
jgi:formylglycine-generating enzyme required for sulfatase activity